MSASARAGSTVLAQFAGACASAAVGVALVLSTGLIAFAPLGPEYASDGVCAAFAARSRATSSRPRRADRLWAAAVRARPAR
jgi:hypothetical protein